MKLEGQVCGYNKKTLAIVGYTLAIIMVAFFAGTRYEKNKLNSLQSSKESGAKKGLHNATTKARKNQATTQATPQATNATAPTEAVSTSDVTTSTDDKNINQ